MANKKFLIFDASARAAVSQISSTDTIGGFTVEAAEKIQFRDSAIHISSDADAYLNIQADTGVNLNIGGTDELALTAAAATFGGNIIIPDAGNIGSASDGDAIAISAAGVVALSCTTAASATTTAALTVAGGLGVAGDLWLGDDLVLDSDGAVLQLGADQDVSITHVADTGVILQATSAATNSVVDAFVVDVQSSGTPAAGLGAGLVYKIETAAGNTETVARIAAVSTNVGDNSEASDIVFHTQTGGSSADEAGRFSRDSASGAGRLYLYDKGGEYIAGTGSRLDLVGAEVKVTASGAAGYSVDSAGDISFDASGGQVYFKLDGSTALELDISTATAPFFKLNGGSGDLIFKTGIGSEIARFDGSQNSILMASSNPLEFRDTALKIHSSADGQLDIDADVEVEIEAPAVEIKSSTASAPVLHITNSHAGATSGELRFNKDSASGAASDVMGMISFYGTDDDDNAHERLAYIDAIITDAADGSEASSLRFYVAENDATLTQGLLIAGQADDNGEVDVTIGAGSGSSATVSGDLTVTGSFTVNGTQTIVNSTTIELDDKNIELAKGVGNDAAVDGGGVTLVSTDGNKTFQWADTGDNWASSENMSLASGKAYKINNTSVLNATTLGSAVVSSSLTSVGTIASGVWSAGAVTSSGRIVSDDTTEATSTTDGSLQTDGGLSVAKSAVIGDDLDLLSDGAIVNIGSTSKFTLTDQAANNCVMAASGHRLAFGDAGEYVSGDGTNLLVVSSGDVVVTGDLIPSADDTYDLGTTAAAWQDLHLEGDVLMTDAGKVSTAAGTLTLEAAGSDADIVFAGNDGGSSITALTLDMSEAGNATFNGSITCATSLTIGSAAMSEADLEKLDGITDGTAAANKALVLDGSKDVSGINALGIASMASNWTNAGRTVADLGVVTTVDINGGSIDGAVIGAASVAAGSFAAITGASLVLASGATCTAILDEDAMGSNSATALATQQSIKAYVDSQGSGSVIPGMSPAGSGGPSAKEFAYISAADTLTKCDSDDLEDTGATPKYPRVCGLYTGTNSFIMQGKGTALKDAVAITVGDPLYLSLGKVTTKAAAVAANSGANRWLLQVGWANETVLGGAAEVDMVVMIGEAVFLP